MLYYILCGVLAYYQPWIIYLGRFEKIIPQSAVFVGSVCKQIWDTSIY